MKNAKQPKRPVIQKVTRDSKMDIQTAIDFIVEHGFKVIHPDSVLEQNLREGSR
jgi:hypothetical protein